MDSPSDSELLRAARSGDDRALEQLFERYQPRVWRFARRMCDTSEDAEDVLQDALLGALRGFREFRGDAAFQTWLFSIARHACSKHRRRLPPEATSTTRVEALDSASGGETATDTPGPEQEASLRQLAAAVVQAINELEPPQREALVLRDVEGLSASEVAEVTGSSVDAVKSRLHRARRNVQRRAAEIAEPRLVEPLTPGGPATCPDILQLFSEQLEGDVSPAMCELIHEHVDLCPVCQATCDSLKRTLALCRAVPLGPVPPHIQRAVEQALRSERNVL